MSKIENCYRSIPFWGWNARLDIDELTYQIDEMNREGMGGFFIHSREGLETEYLSEQWMNAVKHTIDCSKEKELEVWIYDEDKWPSGSAGGLVSQIGDGENTAKAVTLEVMSVDCAKSEVSNICLDGNDENILSVVTVRLEGNCIIELCDYDDSLDSNWKVLIFRREVSSSSEWYNGLAPTDNLNPNAVKQFIKLTHEKYRQVCESEFGRTVKGFFTDEPNFCDFFSKFTNNRPWIPWSDSLDIYFLKNRGYELKEKLAYLFFEGEGYQKIRHDFWWTITQRFNECYFKQVYDWCEENKVSLTGHVLYENDLGYSVRVSGASMPHYKYMHAPGIDILGEQTKEYLTVKQCTSVANQFGRQNVFTETYGCTGWDFTFEGQKWLGDWQFVMGVTRRCQHMALYSISGCRKRDYPPFFNYYTNWWRENHILEDYFAEVSKLLSKGKVVRDILLLHPISSVWMETGSHPNENFENIEMNMGWLDEHITKLNQVGDEYNRLSEMLLRSHFDFDFGDEMILAEHGSIDGDIIKVEQSEYKTLVVPRLSTILESTFDLVYRFLEAGGRVIWVKPFTLKIEASNNDRIALLKEHSKLIVVNNYQELLNELQKNENRIVSVKNRECIDEKNILLMTRELTDKYIVFAVNNDRNKSHEVKIHFRHMGKVFAYDLMMGSRKELAVECSENEVSFVECFTPVQSKVFIIYKNKLPTKGEAEFSYKHPHAADKIWACLGPKSKVTRTMENALVLDKCSYQIDQGAWSEVMDVWQAQRKIRERLNLQQIYYNGAPQRYAWVNKPCESDNKEVALRFEFEVEVVPDDDVYVVVEKPESMNIICNDVLCVKTNNHFLDKSFKKVLIPDLKCGRNEILIRCDYKNQMELEDIYIIGDFGVSANRTVIGSVTDLYFSDWTLQGLMHYPGNIIYNFEITNNIPSDKNLIMKIGEYDGSLLKIRVNGCEDIAVIGKTNSKIDITKHLIQGNNLIEIEVVGSPRNLFGPFHQKYTGCSRISWQDFRTEGDFYTPDYIVKPYGLKDQIFIIEEDKK